MIFDVGIILLPSALQPTVGFGLSNSVLQFFPICHQLSPSPHSQHLKISFCFLFPSFRGSSLSSHPFQLLSEHFWGILSSSFLSRWPNQLILCPFIHFTIFSPLLISSSSQFVRLFHSTFSYLGPYILLNIFLSKITGASCSFFINVHASAPYVVCPIVCTFLLWNWVMPSVLHCVRYLFPAMSLYFWWTIISAFFFLNFINMGPCIVNQI